MRSVFEWNLGSRSLELGKRTLIMGIVNVTPDSFSDGGKFLERDKAIEHAEQLLNERADIIDVGGESTRPGARVHAADEGVNSESAHKRGSGPPVSAEEELRRVLPVIVDLKRRHPTAVISVDTYKAVVAQAVVNAGAEIVNDVSGFRWDPQMLATLSELKCGVVLMHMRGQPEEWRKLPPPDDVVRLVTTELKEWSEKAEHAGIGRDRIVLDPGFGFGKSFDENYPLMARFGELHGLGFPLLAGTSRKSFVGRTIAGDHNKVVPEQRLYGTLATEAALVLRGAHILRTHDVKPSIEAARVADAILQAL